MTRKRSPEILLELFASKTVVDLGTIREALGGVSAMTAFRHLWGVFYRRSYNRNGGFYCLHEPDRYDRSGLWSGGDVRFSNDGDLASTVRRLVHEAEAGATHRELRERLRVRVQNTLLGLLRKGEIDRERLAEAYLYLHTDADSRRGQLALRRERIAASSHPSAEAGPEVAAEAVIEVLLVLIRHPGSKPAQVARRLLGCSPPIPFEHVRAVFDRYDLGEKGGPSNC